MDVTSDPTQPISPVTPQTSSARRIFFRDKELRVGWRLLIFLGLLMACEMAIRSLLVRIPAIHELLRQGQSGSLTPASQSAFEGAVIVGLFLATFLMGRIEKRSFATYGLPLAGAFGKMFWQGALWGLAIVSAEMLAMYALHGFSFGGIALSGFTLVKYAVTWALSFVLVGIFEEFTFRGYFQFTLGEGIGFWPSAVLLSAAFGAVHIGNPGEGWVGALSVMLFGLFACFTLRRTGSLWFAIGLHAAGDYAESFIYSVPDSGLVVTGHLLNSSTHGPRWLTGGAVGPEGSVLDFVVFLASFLIFAWLYPAQRPNTLRP